MTTDLTTVKAAYVDTMKAARARVPVISWCCHAHQQQIENSLDNIMQSKNSGLTAFQTGEWDEDTFHAHLSTLTTALTLLEHSLSCLAVARHRGINVWGVGEA